MAPLAVRKVCCAELSFFRRWDATHLFDGKTTSMVTFSHLPRLIEPIFIYSFHSSELVATAHALAPITGMYVRLAAPLYCALIENGRIMQKITASPYVSALVFVLLACSFTTSNAAISGSADGTGTTFTRTPFQKVMELTARSLTAADESTHHGSPSGEGPQFKVSSEIRTYREYQSIAPIVRMSENLPPDQRKVTQPAQRGERLIVERLTRWDSVVIDREVISRTVVRKARPAFVLRGLMPARAFTVVATAYTASSAGSNGGGQTSTGSAARYGVVAVDPHLIPLGSRLFIPGYGHAVAADTGGAILGHRIDLCMNSLGAALTFGRQVVKVYVLRR